MSRREIILIVAIGFLIVFSILNYVKINELEGRMNVVNNIQSEVYSVNHSVQEISSKLQWKLDEFSLEQLWIQEKGYHITSIDIEEDTIDVILEWSMRDLLHQENISFLYRDERDKEWTELEVTNYRGLNYSIAHTFPLEGNFETQVIATSEVGTRSENLLDLRFKEQLDTLQVMTDAYLHQGTRGWYDVSIDIYNPLENDFIPVKNRDDLKIKSAMAYLYVNGNIIKEMDLLELNENYHSDSYSENLYFHEGLNLENEIGENDNVELHIIVVNRLGMKYETIAETMY